jgi:hypothetical protein
MALTWFIDGGMIGTNRLSLLGTEWITCMRRSTQVLVSSIWLLLMNDSIRATERSLLVPLKINDWNVTKETPWGKSALVPVAGQAFSQAWHITVLAKPPNSWDIIVIRPIVAGLAKKQLYKLKFWARCLRSEQNDIGQVYVLVQPEALPRTPALSIMEPITSEWTEHKQIFYPEKDIPAKGFVAIQFGIISQEIEIGAIDLQIVK